MASNIIRMDGDVSVFVACPTGAHMVEFILNPSEGAAMGDRGECRCRITSTDLLLMAEQAETTA